MINLIFTLLVISAIVISLLIIGFLILWLKGVDSLAFPGLGLIVATPFFPVLLTILQLVVIIAAIFVSGYRADIHTIVGI